MSKSGKDKNNKTNEEEKWLDWAIELQSLAQAGLAYGKDKYDIERYERIREITAEMISHKTEISVAKVKDLFCNEIGYQTPKIDVRTAIFEKNKILLVQEDNGKWTLPGGWAEVNLTVKENVVKETKEEAGLDIIPKSLISILDVGKRNHKKLPYGIYKIFVLCDYVSGEFKENLETINSGYFWLEEVEELNNKNELATMKITFEQIRICFEANENKDKWKVIFD